MEKRLLAHHLHEYLVSLASALEGHGGKDASKQVLHVSRFAAGSTSELYGEARLLLPKILRENSTNLSDLEKARLQKVIAGIEQEFNRVGGG